MFDEVGTAATRLSRCGGYEWRNRHTCVVQLSTFLGATQMDKVQFGGNTEIISNVADDGVGAVSFDIDVNGDLGGSTHNGSVKCPGPVRIVSEQHRDGSGHYDG